MHGNRMLEFGFVKQANPAFVASCAKANKATDAVIIEFQYNSVWH